MFISKIDPLPKSYFITQPLSQSWEGIKDQNLYWLQPSRLQNEYLLFTQEHILGTLHYEEKCFLRRAAAKTTQGEWCFKYTRFALPKVTIQKKNSLLAETTLETDWGQRGNLELPDGTRYIWEADASSKNKFCFLTPQDNPVVFFRPRFGFLKLEAEVEIDPAVLHNPHIPLLTLLGWFLVLLRLR